MRPIVFTPTDTPALRRAVQFLRRMEQGLPGAAHPKAHEGVLMAALALDEQADKQGAAPVPTLRETRRPIFNQLVAPAAGGPVFHDEAKAMLDAHEDAVRAETRAALDLDPGRALSAAEVELLRIKGALLSLHPKTGEPRHGCCAAPKLCKGHRPECRSSEHTIGGQVPWPCKTLRAAGIHTDADADAVRKALTRLDQAADPDGYPGRKKAARGRAVHATKSCDGTGDIGACGLFFGTNAESTDMAPDAAVSCQACVKALVRKRAEADAATANEDTHRCTLPPTRRLPCGCCPHQVCEDCDRCAHKCECGTGCTPTE